MKIFKTEFCENPFVKGRIDPLPDELNSYLQRRFILSMYFRFPLPWPIFPFILIELKQYAVH